MYHVLNRSVGMIRLLRTDKDYLAFENLLIEAHERHSIRILAYCLMASHWHFVVWPTSDGQITDFFRWLTHTHVMRWRTSHQTVGYGPLYQGRFRNFAVQRDEHLLAICRYVERNAVSAKLVRRAQDWRWSSLWARQHGSPQLQAILSDWPVHRPSNWLEQVNRPVAAAEREAILTSIRRGRPFGNDQWLSRTVAKLNVEHTLRREGRPSRKRANKG